MEMKKIKRKMERDRERERERERERKNEMNDVKEGKRKIEAIEQYF